ncbi:MAG: hypothetical protein R6U65_05375, partial [Perlabentimonas sp.]
MILIVDSGSTKAHWRALKSDGEVIQFETVGFNPLRSNSGSFQESLKNEIPNSINFSAVESLFFYGAGCISNEMERRVKYLLSKFF